VAPCASISLGGFAIQGQNASWSLTNNNPLTITISGVYLEWNPVNQRLDQIRVGGNLIWEGADEESPTNASDGGAVGSGSSKGISFTFKRAAAGSGYFLRVSLSNGCQFTASK
jgi:hypothetical protein